MIHPLLGVPCKLAAMRLRRTLRQAGTLLVYAAAFAVIILYGTHLASPWLQAAAH